MNVTRTMVRILLTLVLPLLANSQAMAAVNVGDVMPNVAIVSADGKANLKWDGKVAILNFWATWCDACKVELKEMNKAFAPLYERKDVLVGYVSLDKDTKKASAYMQETFGPTAGVTKNIAFDAEFKAADSLGIDSFPMTLVIGKNGKIIHIQRGFKEGEGSTEAILKLALAQ